MLKIKLDEFLEDGCYLVMTEKIPINAIIDLNNYCLGASDKDETDDSWPGLVYTFNNYMRELFL